MTCGQKVPVMWNILMQNIGFNLASLLWLFLLILLFVGVINFFSMMNSLMVTFCPASLISLPQKPLHAKKSSTLPNQIMPFIWPTCLYTWAVLFSFLSIDASSTEVGYSAKTFPSFYLDLLLNWFSVAFALAKYLPWPSVRNGTSIKDTGVVANINVGHSTHNISMLIVCCFPTWAGHGWIIVFGIFFEGQRSYWRSFF